MEAQPLVSFICVSMNHEKYVAQGVNSFVAQTYPEMEFLYADNVSHDKSFEIADEIFRRSGRPYQGFKRDAAYNLPQNFNFLIRKAKGDYLCFISCDDWVEPEFIATMISEYKKQPQAGMLYSNGCYYYQDTNTAKIAENKKFISGKIFDHIFINSALFPPGIVVKRETMEKLGLFNENLPVEDYEYWLRVASEFEIGYSPKPMVYYRKHSQSMTLVEGHKYFWCYQAIADQYKDHKLYKRVSRDLRKLVIYDHFLKKQNGKALRLLIKDFRFERFYFALLYRMMTGNRMVEQRT